MKRITALITGLIKVVEGLMELLTAVWEYITTPVGRSKSPGPLLAGSGPGLRVQKPKNKRGINPRHENEV